MIQKVLQKVLLIKVGRDQRIIINYFNNKKMSVKLWQKVSILLKMIREEKEFKWLLRKDKHKKELNQEGYSNNKYQIFVKH